MFIKNKVKKIRIISLSKGTIGEPFVQHEIKIGLERLKKFGLDVDFSNSALKGIDFVEKHPEQRAKDLIDAFKDDSVDMILCAIGGDDTFRLLPFLFSNNELKNAVKKKIFLGFSDSTINHLMLHKVGIKTFYGQSFLTDICDIGKKMIPYSKKYFKELIKTGKISQIIPSSKWYESRKDFSEQGIGKELVSHKNQGFILLQGKPKFEGEILGGCIDSLYDIFSNKRYEDSVEIYKKFKLFPEISEWKNKILLIETSEEKASPELFKDMLMKLKEYGIFNFISGIIVGKPCDNYLYDEYQKVLLEVIENKKLPILYNFNVGHCNPRCIVPFGVKAFVDVNKQKITFDK